MVHQNYRLWYLLHTVIKASKRLCICDTCKTDYGSCSLFRENILESNARIQIFLRSSVPTPENFNETEPNEDLSDYISPNSYVAAAAADINSIDTVWFIKVIENGCISTGQDGDDYGHFIMDGVKYNKGCFLQRVDTLKNTEIYKLSKKVIHFYSESVVYPFVDLVLHKNE